MLTDILEINQAALAEVYDFVIENDTVGMVFGAAGVGKTEMAIQAVKKHNLIHYHVNLAVLEAPDLLGIPITTKGKTSYAPPEILPWHDADNPSPPVTLLLDEIDKAKPDLQNPLLELLQFKSINGKPLNLQGIICTGNLPDERAFSKKISHPLANRCSIYKVKHEFAPWRRWAVGSGLNPLVISFLQNYQDLLYVRNESGDPTAYCTPSPRSWSMAARDLDYLDFDKFSTKIRDQQTLLSEDDKLEEEELVDFIERKYIEQQFRLVAGRVGQSAAMRLKMWLSYYRELEPIIDEIIKNGGIDVGLTSDKQIICATALISKMKFEFTHLTMPERIQLGERVFSWMIKSLSPAFMLASIKSTLNADLVNNYGLLDCDSFNKMMDIIHDTAT